MKRAILMRRGLLGLLVAAIAFAVSYYVASAWVQRRSGGWTRQLIEGVEKEAWRFIAFVRPLRTADAARGIESRARGS